MLSRNQAVKIVNDQIAKDCPTLSIANGRMAVVDLIVDQAYGFDEGYQPFLSHMVALFCMGYKAATAVMMGQTLA